MARVENIPASGCEMMPPGSQQQSMTTVRLEAFSDAVIAIIITIMVLELKVPHGAHIEDLAAVVPIFLSYIVSFLYVGIYWNNHHHLLQTCKEVTGSILWANLHLLFWLSLFPFAAGWLERITSHPCPRHSMPVYS